MTALDHLPVSTYTFDAVLVNEHNLADMGKPDEICFVTDPYTGIRNPEGYVTGKIEFTDRKCRFFGVTLPPRSANHPLRFAIIPISIEYERKRSTYERSENARIVEVQSLAGLIAKGMSNYLFYYI